MMKSQRERTSTDSFRFKAPAQRQCRGSLPLKKRRFHEITTFHETTVHVPQPSSDDPLISLTENRHQSTEEKIATLALVAAAAGGDSFSNTLVDGQGRQNTCHIQQQQQQQHFHHGDPQQNETKYNPLHNEKFKNPLSSAARALNGNLEVGLRTNGNTTKALTAPQPRQRVHHPPLAAPIPGGCHGRTSRNNSYCRRTPCYNGSKYCKLHYQQYVVQGGADPNGNNGSAIRLNGVKMDRGEMRLNGMGQGGTTALKCNGVIEGSENVTSHHRHHQDKRYTGQCKDEMRCLATTTRGRSCAYVAVTGTKYCHLHADYDINPPPRRGGGSNNSKTKAAAISTKMETSSSVELMPITGSLQQVQEQARLSVSFNSQRKEPQAVSSLQPVAFEKGKLQSAPSSISSAVSSLKATVKKATNKIGVQLHPTVSNSFHNKKEVAPSSSNQSSTLNPPPPYPLLNSIPSDKWSKRLVLISTGPLVNHVGRVVKWGNGWITVSTQTGGNGKNRIGGGELLHNRRAIELYLLPEEGVTSKLKTETKSFLSTSSESVRDFNETAFATTGVVKKSSPCTGMSVNQKNADPNTNKVELNCLLSSHKRKLETTQANTVLNEKTVNSHLINSSSEEIKSDLAVVSTESCVSSKTLIQNLTSPLEIKTNGLQTIENNSKRDSKRKGISEEKRVHNLAVVKPLQNVESSAQVGTDSKNSMQTLTRPSDNKSNALQTVQNDAKQDPKREEIFKEKGLDNSAFVKPLQNIESRASGKKNLSGNIPSLEAIPSVADDKNAIDQNKNKNPNGQLCLMEELILAQSGRRVKNVDLALGSSGRTINKPERYENIVMVEKKLNHRQQQNQNNHDSIGGKDGSVSSTQSPKQEKIKSYRNVEDPNSIPQDKHVSLRQQNMNFGEGTEVKANSHVMDDPLLAHQDQSRNEEKKP